MTRDYAAALATPVKKWFWEPLCQGKIPKAAVLDAESSPRMTILLLETEDTLPSHVCHVPRLNEPMNSHVAWL